MRGQKPNWSGRTGRAAPWGRRQNGKRDAGVEDAAPYGRGNGALQDRPAGFVREPCHRRDGIDRKRG